MGDLETQKCLGLLGTHDGGVTAVKTFRRVVTLPDTGDGVVTIDVADFDRKKAFGHLADGSLRVWDMRQSKEPLVKLESHMGAVTAAHVNFDLECAASASLDGTIKVWSLNPAECMLNLEGH